MRFEESLIFGFGRGWCIHDAGVHAESSAGGGVSGRGQFRPGAFFGEGNADEAPFRVEEGVAVVAHVAVFLGEEGVVFAYADVFAGEPFRALRVEVSFLRVWG